MCVSCYCVWCNDTWQECRVSVYVSSYWQICQENAPVANFLHTLNKAVHIQWNYFATSHGKGVVDGISGSLKRLVQNAVLSRKLPPIVHAQSFFQVANSLTTCVANSLTTSDCFTCDTKENEWYLRFTISEEMLQWSITSSSSHCIEPRDDGSVNCCLYSFQSLIKNRVWWFWFWVFQWGNQWRWWGWRKWWVWWWWQVCQSGYQQKVPAVTPKEKQIVLSSRVFAMNSSLRLRSNCHSFYPIIWALKLMQSWKHW